MGIEANKQLVAKFMELFSEARLDEAFELVSDDVVWSLWGSGPAAGSYDKTAMRAMLDQSFGFFVGPLQWTPARFTAEGDRVGVEAVSYGKTRRVRVPQQVSSALSGSRWQVGRDQGNVRRNSGSGAIRCSAGGSGASE